MHLGAFLHAVQKLAVRPLSGAALVTGIAPKELEAKVTTFFGKPCHIVYSETVFYDDSTDQQKRVRTLLDISAI
ncbi:hypothetical protein [Thauera sp.]|uniref:hypothetical protein n=1 Tax=Thauera sp. TaxID=1905334 RepID=UPI002BDF27B7|nr:hypothetical protein [Thauera sp.]HRO35346.1 hypothetical protein [Thauera sp.]